MATYVLTAGAWLGGWVWRRVAPAIREAGHTVYTPTLTGLGERVHLAGPGVDLDTHITDLVNLIHYEDLDEVILAGHSYGGFPVWGVAERIPERLSQVVFVDGMFPYEGMDRVVDFFDPELAARVEALAASDDPGLPRLDQSGLMTMGITDADEAWLARFATDHPAGTMVQRAPMGNPAAAALPHVYLWCSSGLPDVPEYLAWMREAPNWQLHTLETGHWPMVSAPEETARLLLDLAS